MTPPEDELFVLGEEIVLFVEKQSKIEEVE